jgi:hypothetical protein
MNAKSKQAIKMDLQKLDLVNLEYLATLYLGKWNRVNVDIQSYNDPESENFYRGFGFSLEELKRAAAHYVDCQMCCEDLITKRIKGIFGEDPLLKLPAAILQ